MLKRDISATFTGNAAGFLLSLCTSVILARTLGPANRGLLGLAMLIPAVAARFCTLGQEMVNLTFGGLYKDRRKNLFQQSVIVTIAGSVVSTVCICAFYFWLPVDKGRFGELPHGTVWLVCLVVPLVMFSTMIIALVRGVGKITTAAFLHVFQIAGFLLLLAAVVVWRGLEFKTALILMTLKPVITIIASIWVLRELVTFRPSDFCGRLFKESLGFGFQLSLASFAGFLIYRIDQGMLAYMVPLHQVGLYVVAVNIAERLRMVPSSISGAFLPRLANELSARQQQVPLVFRCTTVVSVAAMLVVAGLGVPAIFALYGPDFSGMISPFLLLLPGIASLGGSSILASDLMARKKPKYSIFTGYTVLAANIILNLALIPVLGINGAAVASSASYIAQGILWIFFYLRESKMAPGQMIPRAEDVRLVTAASGSMLRDLTMGGVDRLKSVVVTVLRVGNERR